MAERPTPPPIVEDVATQPEDDDPLSLVGEPADAPQDTGRREDADP